MRAMTKTELLNRLCIRQSQLARLLGVSRSAVAQWPDDQPIPEKQELRLRYQLMPGSFGSTAASASEPRAHAGAEIPAASRGERIGAERGALK